MYNNNDYRDYLAHFGILGMKWGVRRYQNPDGSLTEAGKRRYRVGDITKYAVKKNIDWTKHAVDSYAKAGKAAYTKTKEAIKTQAEKERQEDAERFARNKQILKERENEKNRKSGNRNTNTLNEARKKDINELSTRELRDYNNRLRAEREFAELTKGSSAAGKQFVSNMASQIVTGIVVGAAVSAGKNYLLHR